MIEYNKSRIYGAAENFIDGKLSMGIFSFSLAQLIASTGLSLIAAKNQLLRLGGKVTRVSPRQQYFLIVTPENRVVGAPPIEKWLDDYFVWLNRPYYLALQSAAAVFGSSQQAIQEIQVMTNSPISEITVGLLRIRFFTKSSIKNTITQQLPDAYAPLKISTPESTAFDLIRYASVIGGIERAAETIQPMVSAIKTKELRRVLDSENELATTQRLGFVLQSIKADRLAKVVIDWLPQRIKTVPISTHVKSDDQAPISKEWGIKNNSRSFM